MGAKHWTKEEEDKLREIYASGRTIKECADMIPGRTIEAMRAHCWDLGFAPRGSASRSHYRWVERAIIRVLSEGAPLTVIELAQATGASYHRIRFTMYEGHGTKWHIAGYTRVYARGSQSPKWTLGAGEDAPKPGTITKEEYNRRARERMKLKSGKINPFLVAAAAVAPKQTTVGRVYRQDMTIRSRDEMEAA